MLLNILAILNLLVALDMWLRRTGSVRQKLYFSLLLLFPGVGLVFYLAMYDPPSSHTPETEYPNTDQA